MLVRRHLSGPASARWHIACGQGVTDTRAHRFADRHAALAWLRHFRREPMAMATLRAMLLQCSPSAGALNRAGDEQVLEQLSWLLSRGTLEVRQVPPVCGGYGGATKAAGEPAQTSSSPTAPRATSAPLPVSTPPPAEAEPNTFSVNSDGAATAAVLRKAAKKGVPFCEECAKATAARKAAA